jgi:hypothetical protein
MVRYKLLTEKIYLFLFGLSLLIVDVIVVDNLGITRLRMMPLLSKEKAYKRGIFKNYN